MEAAEGKAKGGRLSKRRNERIRTFYKINNQLNERAELPQEEIDSYVQNIDKNCQAKFGVMKLSKYNLNVYCQVVDDTKVSLLQYAAIRSPNVCLSLFYAGADPSYDCYDNQVVFPHARAILLKYPTPYIIWLNLLVAYSKPHEDLKCLHCHDPCSHFILSPCQHSICRLCFWKQLEKQRIDEDFSCPVCGEEVINPKSKTGARPPPSNLPPHDIAQKSFDAYSQLSHIPPTGHKNVKPTIEALPLWRSLQLYVGLTPKQRDTEMFKAVAADNSARIRALVEVGVDVNCKNEYGQTPLFIASWMGYDRVVKALLESGASAELTDNANVLPIQAAHANGHMDVVSSLGSAVDIENLSWKITGAPNFVELIPSDSSHPGAGSGYFDDIFPEEFLCKLEELHQILPVAPKEKESCSDRSYFCDSMGWLIDGIQRACGRTVFPNMRFLHYSQVGGYLPAHVDLSRTDIHGITSTKTFIIYLSTCTEGGETNLLTSINPDREILAGVKPKRGRLLIFPHLCPHEGATVHNVPKLLLRGEMY